MTNLPVKTTDKPAAAPGMWHSFASLRDDVDRMLDNFMRGMPSVLGGRGTSDSLWKFETAVGMTPALNP